MDAEVLETTSLVGLMHQSQLFAHLDDAGRKRILEGATAQNFGAGDAIVHEGDPGDTFFFIREGQVEVATNASGQRLVLASLGAGDFFGEVSVLTAQPRTATVTATQSTKVLCFARRKISRVLMDYPEVTRVLGATIVERADDTIRKISS